MKNVVHRLQRARETNSTATGFTATIPTLTAPVPDGMIPLVRPKSGGRIPAYIKLWFIGLGAENDAYSARVWGWNQVASTTDNTILWQPTLAAEVAVILGTAVGVTGSPVLATERYADTYTIVANRQSVRHGLNDAVVVTRGRFWTFSPTNDLIGYCIVPLDGYDRLTFDFADTTNTPTKNVLYEFLDRVT